MPGDDFFFTRVAQGLHSYAMPYSEPDMLSFLTY